MEERQIEMLGSQLGRPVGDTGSAARRWLPQRAPRRLSRAGLTGLAETGGLTYS